MNYTLIRSKRKTVAIHIKAGNVEVRAPQRMAQRDIDKFVLSKEKWINEKLAKSKEETGRREVFSLNYGDFVAYRGDLYPIVSTNLKRPVFKNEQFCIPFGLSSEEIKNSCITIYRKLAKQDLLERVDYFAESMSLSPASIKINSAKSRWGSCSAKKNINFSWMLIMADDGVIDYIVVHELAHLIELNHSPRFWKIVESVLPDYKKRQKRLKELQNRLNGEKW
jgi:predicted metal-dependent hydrolase